MADKDKKWFEQGKGGWDKAKKEDDEAKSRREQSRDPRGRRFFLKSDESAKVTWLDTPNFFLHEHTLKDEKGKWRVYVTCLKDFATCPLCESGLNSSYVAVGTVISHKVWTDKDGKKHTNEKVLFVAKGRARDRLGRQIQLREGDLKYCVYEMVRGGSSTECATGEEFEFSKRLEEKVIRQLVPKGEDPKEWLKPYDYKELFKPKSAEELRKLVGAAAPIGSEEADPDTGADEADEGPRKEKDEGSGEATSIDDLL